MTHNTREVEEWKREFQQLCAEDAEYQLRDRGVQAKIIAFIHHQLQKARHDWLQEEIVKLEEIQSNIDNFDYDSDERGKREILTTIITWYKEELLELEKGV